MGPKSTSLVFAFCFVVVSVYSQDQSHLPECTAELQNRHFPSGFDCEHYFTCFNGAYFLQQCPSPQIWFQRTTETCNIPAEVRDCEFAPTTVAPTTVAPTTVPPTTVSTTIQPTTVPASTTIPSTVSIPTTLITTTVSSPLQVECSAQGVSKAANPHSCTRYFMCYDGVAVTRTCSPGLYFSRSQLRCVRRADSDCLLTNESCPAENDPRNVVFLPDQEECQKYFICHDGAPVEFDCGDTLHWDPNNNWCIREEESDCEPSYPLPEVREIECPEDTENDIIFLPHPEECQFYFICLDGESILTRCATNMLFDFSISKCNFADRAICFNHLLSFNHLSN